MNLFNYNLNNQYKNLIQKINVKREEIKCYSNELLAQQTEKLQNELKTSKINDQKIIINAFATIKEAIFRSTGITLFDVQILGSLIINNGNIAEMKTGEGKTLVALLPAYLQSLENKGLHIITVNDYLAERDGKLAQKIFSYLNISIGIITQDTKSEDRQKEYNKNVTYITNSELGFDYLKDNMAIHKNDILQRNFNYAIIDEVDSILIDEARTPLIISGTSKIQKNFYQNAYKISNNLVNRKDYKIDEKSKSIVLTVDGISKCERILQIENLYNINTPWIKYIINALKAKELFIRNKDYIVQDNQITIVDEFTGRIMIGRRWSEGLHQAVEAKENVKIEAENKVLASITYQNLFLLYNKISGMTGTAKTEEKEFMNVYKMNVISVPENKKCLRKDLPDLVYKNEYSKWQAVASECEDMYAKGRPTLIGTTSIKQSEVLSEMLKKLNIPHNLLNAKPENVAKESNIILKAGQYKAITISTNMAGRGTDIVLGGNPKIITNRKMRNYISNEYYKNNKTKELDEKEISLIIEQITFTLDNKQEANNNISNIDNLVNTYKEIKRKTKIECESAKEKILTLGGLYVIGTERHESRRIDNQLRGRSGRQGDIGASRFFLSLQDNLFRIFGGKNIENIIDKLNIDDNTPIESILLTRSLNSAQKKVEAYFYDIRKQLFEYDEVIHSQRKAIYSERKKILSYTFNRDCIIEYGEQTIQEMLNIYYQNRNNQFILDKIMTLLNVKLDTEILSKMSDNELRNYFSEQLRISYDLKEIYLEQLRPGLIRQLEKYYLLQQIDKAWQEHIDKMTLLKEYIGWRSYGQQDPLIEYKNEAFNLFINMITYIRQTVIYLLMRSRLIVDM